LLFRRYDVGHHAPLLATIRSLAAAFRRYFRRNFATDQPMRMTVAAFNELIEEWRRSRLNRSNRSVPVRREH
jgi:hypothetical protein